MNLFKRKKEEFVSPIQGKLVDLDQVPDPVFSGCILGQGFAIEPESGKVVAPMSGILTVVFPTKHAYGIQTNDGIEILLHLGVDTVELGGMGFTSYVKQGAKVKQGDILVDMDLAYIKSQGKSTICPVIFTSGEAIAIQRYGQVSLLEKNIIQIG